MGTLLSTAPGQQGHPDTCCVTLGRSLPQEAHCEEGQMGRWKKQVHEEEEGWPTFLDGCPPPRDEAWLTGYTQMVFRDPLSCFATE